MKIDDSAHWTPDKVLENEDGHYLLDHLSCFETDEQREVVKKYQARWHCVLQKAIQDFGIGKILWL